MPRIALGGISHETNTFATSPTQLEQFGQRVLLRGGALPAASRGVGTTLGGLVDAAELRGWELVPTLFAAAMPGGRVRRGTFETLARELVDGIAAGRPLDGVLLALHGAMVVEGIDDGEGELLRRVRRAAGPNAPIAVVVDFHANLSQAMADQADVIVAYHEYPHIDARERGQEAVELLARLLVGRTPVYRALRQVPLLAALPAQRTDGPTPMRELRDLARDLERRPGVLAVALAGGFPYADIRDAGLSVLVTAERADLAADVADILAAACWERREAFRLDLPGVAAAVRMALAETAGPVVLADVGDNPGAGAAGDSTALLAALLDAGARDVAIATIADPETVARAAALGPGGFGAFELGGKLDRRYGPPLPVEGFVRSVEDIAFVNRGPMGRGARTRLGRSAVLTIAGIDVIVCERRVQVLEPEFFRAAGIAPEEKRVLVVKSGVHFRAGFEPLAARIVEVDSPGLAATRLETLPYRRVRRPIWPLDDGEC